jgi:hypothetical protein
MSTINSTIEHLELPPILIDGLSLPLLPPRRQISLTNLVEERHHPPLVPVRFKDSYTPMPYTTMVTVSIFYKPNLIKSLRPNACKST